MRGKPWSACTQDYPLYTLSYTLSTIQTELQNEAADTQVIAYWILDDWNFTNDPGGAAAILPQIAQMVHSITGKPIICGFGAGITANKQYSWAPALAQNFSPGGCDAVGLYIYSSSVLDPNTSPSTFDWSMSSLLPAMFKSLADCNGTCSSANGWNVNNEPLIGIAQGWAGTRKNFSPVKYEIAPTADDIIEQSISFCEHGATGIAYYGWITSGVDPLYTPENSAAMKQGVQQGITSCQTIWGNRSAYQTLGTYTAVGFNVASTVGPGPDGNQNDYISYYYPEGSLDLVVIDPNDPGSPRVFHSPLLSERGAWGLVVGPDNNIYLGTSPHGHLLRFNPQSQTLVDLGTVPGDPVTNTVQTNLVQLIVSPYDHNIYGCTYPSADVVRYNPLASPPTFVNLGSVDSTNPDARYCAADPNPQSPYLYIGLGSATGKVVAFNVASNQTVQPALLSNTVSGSFGKVLTAINNTVYGSVKDGQYCQLSNGAVGQCVASVNVAPTNVFSDGTTITLNDQSVPTTLTINSNNTTTTYPYTYSGQNQPIQRLALGPNGDLYGSGYDRAYLWHVSSGGGKVQLVGYLGRGHEDSLLSVNSVLYMAGANWTGSTAIPVGSYNPSAAFQLGTNPAYNTTIAGNLTQQTMIYNISDDKVYIGSIAGPGQLTGYLTLCDPANVQNCTQYQPLANEGVTSLTTIGSGSTIIGGTTIYGGAGSKPFDTLATIFSWNAQTEQRTSYVDLPNITQVTDLISGGTCNATASVYGIGKTSSGYELFMADPNTLKLGATVNSPYIPIYNSIGIGPDGNLWGLASQGIFQVNVQGCTPVVKLVALSPAPITNGFAINGNTLYYSSGNVISSYTIS
ncbi:MAG TPA: hypothetical protein VFV38_51405 [Ktedonobacteraceae bacterium]|nr:hypothetical protein [Ktedonobacteraceae bacterium]